MQLSNLNTQLIIASPEQIREAILNTCAISADVRLIDGRPAIKVENHLSLFSLVNKLRANFSFEIFHKKETNSYILYII